MMERKKSQYTRRITEGLPAEYCGFKDVYKNMDGRK